MKVVHVMRPSLFASSVLEFYSQNSFCGEHNFVFYLYKSESSPLRQDLHIEQKDFFISGIDDILNFLEYINNYDFVILHSFFFDSKFKMLLFLKKPLLKKIVWIEFGADLYSWKSSRGIKSILNNYIDSNLRNHFGYFVGIFPPDCDVFRNDFPKSKSKLFYAPYMGSRLDTAYNSYDFTSSLDSHIKFNREIIIQIGHNAFKSLNHIDTLKKLQFLRGKKVRLLLPLSYGDTNYGDIVQKYAEAWFPGQVYCLRDVLPKEKYFTILDNVDIAIFNTYRQAGLGNLHRLILKNKKIYLPCESVMYKYFSEKGVSVYAYEDICEEKLTSLFSTIDNGTRENNMRYINELKDTKKRTQYWEQIYCDLEKIHLMTL